METMTYFRFGTVVGFSILCGVLWLVIEIVQKVVSIL
jgi:hypothetical protein